LWATGRTADPFTALYSVGMTSKAHLANLLS
jgi:hypothetical protein